MEELLKSMGAQLKLHVSKDLNDLIKHSGVYVKYCLSLAQEKEAEININMNLIEDV